MTQGASAQAGPGTADHFYAVGGVGDVVTHPETGEPLRNPQSGDVIIQEHPRLEAEAPLAAAQAKLAEVPESQRAAYEQAVVDAQAAVDNADARYAEIVAEHVARTTGG